MIVERSALSRMSRLLTTKAVLPSASWSTTVVPVTRAWSRRPFKGCRLSVTAAGAVTVSVAALLVVAACPEQSSAARNCAPVSPCAAAKA